MSQFEQKELRDRIRNEYRILNSHELDLALQSEGVEFTIEFKLKDYESNPNKVQSTRFTELGYARQFELVIAETLDKLAQSIFELSFKVNDMIAEWILEKLPNIKKTKDGHISFTQKVYLFNKCKCILPSLLPSFFQKNQDIYKCFSKLYENMTECRHSIVHRSDFEAHEDGSLEFGETDPMVLSKTELKAYVSFTVLLVKFLLDEVPLEKRTHCLNILNSDLDVLKEYHDVLPILNKTEYRLIAVRAIAHEKNEGPLQSPLNISIPIDFIETLLEKQSVVGSLSNMRYILHVVAEDEDTKLEWKIPQQSIQGDKLIILDKSDPNWSKFLSIRDRTHT